ncbi:hypothetical protein [Streptomyces otsuchiensis]|nr:hypothetical protein [Streptomyces otsuchiensis]
MTGMVGHLGGHPAHAGRARRAAAVPHPASGDDARGEVAAL